MHLSHLSWKSALMQAFGEFGGFKAWATCFLAWPSITLSLLQILMFWYCLASLSDGHMDMSFCNSMSCQPQAPNSQPRGEMINF